MDPFFLLLHECLTCAKKAGASDIHIEPKEDLLAIRFRVFGDLELWKEFPLEYKRAFLSRAKAFFNLDLAVVARPQDARASFKEYGFDVRVNSVPTIYGEKIVLRLLDHTRVFDLEKSGLDTSAVSVLKRFAGEKEGLLLISGPTGSGKTTTLYGVLSEIDARRRNVCTLENPVEYRLQGITQIDVGEKGMSFGEGLRALMRQDPDVILVGEIRDEETAELNGARISITS